MEVINDTNTLININIFRCRASRSNVGYSRGEGEGVDLCSWHLILHALMCSEVVLKDTDELSNILTAWHTYKYYILLHHRKTTLIRTFQYITTKQ